MTITLLLEVTHVLWLDIFALSHDLRLDFVLQFTPKSLSVSPPVSFCLSLSHILPHMSTIEFVFVLLSHTYFPICSQFVFNVFSMCQCCCILFALLPNQAVLTVLICSFNFSQYTLPNVPGALPRVPIHSQGCSCSSYRSSCCVPNSTTAASSNVSSTLFEF